MRVLVLCVVVGCGAPRPVAAPANHVEAPVEAVAAAPADAAAPDAAAGSAAEPDANTGFDLYVEANGRPIEAWRLDGERRTDRLPVRIRSIPPGVHAVEIEPPAGFHPASRQITVVAGKSQKIEIVLQPL